MWTNDGNIDDVTIVGNITTSGRKCHYIVTVLHNGGNTTHLLVAIIV